MAAFETAFNLLMKDEGGSKVVNDPRGGVTKYGITQATLYKFGYDLDVGKIDETFARAFYEQWFWNEYRYGEIEDQDLANELLSMCVVAGPSAAHICLQRAVCAAKADPNALKLDGILGPVTRRAIAAGPSCCIASAFRSEEAGYFRDLDDPAFERGWVNRAYR